MIQYNNHNNIKEINYNNHSIKYVYGCGGNLVWSGDTPTPPTGTKFYAEYTGGTSYSAECDGNTALTTGTTKQGGFSTYSAMTKAVIGDCVDTIQYNSFSDCASLTSVTIPSSVTTIQGGAFQYCISLTSVGVVGSGASVEIPNGVTSFEAGGSEFNYCSGLTDVTLGDQITAISYASFSNCFSLSSVTIGSGVTSVGGDAFVNCTSLNSVVINTVTPPTITTASPSSWDAFDNTNNCPIYVPAASVEAYKAASGWSTYASRIQAIPT